ncbi:MAG: sulfotransferase [Actinobacteria bacterium]|nr:MAG: sulfotransferase [Actinomycetota bacterium]
MPNFLVIGAAKAGTTSLYHYLNQHPEVFMSPVKEPKFFALEGEKPDFRGPGDREAWREAISSLDAYQALFEGVTDEKVVGEASPLYLYSEKAPARIKHHVPEARLIAVLRDPVERAYSQFLHKVRDGKEPLADFARAIEAEEGRVKENWAYGWHYKRRGFYYRQLSRYYAMFGPEQIRVYLYEDLKGDPAGLLRDVYGFLGVDDSFVPDMSLKHNVSGIPKNRLVHSLLRGRNPVKAALKPFLPRRLRKRLLVNLQGRNLTEPPGVAPAVRRALIEEYREDVSKLQGLIGRDLSGWLR